MASALSTSSDEIDAPGEGTAWNWLFELAYHHELVGQLLKAWRKTSAARLSATCMFATMVVTRASSEKFTCDVRCRSDLSPSA